jgi:hypothetical protein
VLRPFLTWARTAATYRLGFTATELQRPPPRDGDAEHRWTIARTLLHNLDLDLVDRVAGCLVVRYAQPVARIVTLTAAEVSATDQGVRLRLGPDPLDIPEPLASLIRALPVKRGKSAAQQLPNP